MYICKRNTKKRKEGKENKNMMKACRLPNLGACRRCRFAKEKGGQKKRTDPFVCVTGPALPACSGLSATSVKNQKPGIRVTERGQTWSVSISIPFSFSFFFKKKKKRRNRFLFGYPRQQWKRAAAKKKKKRKRREEK